MSLKKAEGNLLDLAEQGDFDIIVHGCNCQNVMGAGIAKEIKERYPSAWKADCQAHEIFKKPVLLLGNFVWTKIKGERHTFKIVNAYTQLGFYPFGIDHFNYEAFSLILKKLFTIWPHARYGFPYIGMGLAGGDKTRIMKMLEEFADSLKNFGGSATIVEFNE